VEERDRERDNVFHVCPSIRLFLKERDRESLLTQRQGERERGHLRGMADADSQPKCNSLMHSKNQRSNKEWKGLFNNKSESASPQQQQGLRAQRTHK
jgi:hypothetical protein